MYFSIIFALLKVVLKPILIFMLLFNFLFIILQLFNPLNDLETLLLMSFKLLNICLLYVFCKIVLGRSFFNALVLSSIFLFVEETMEATHYFFFIQMMAYKKIICPLNVSESMKDIFLMKILPNLNTICYALICFLLGLAVFKKIKRA